MLSGELDSMYKAVIVNQFIIHVIVIKSWAY